MRIHTNTLTSEDIYIAASVAGATVETASRHGSRSRDGADRNAYAATWDQWGVFLGLLFDNDRDMSTTYDKDGDAFDQRTDGRFSDLDPRRITIPLSHDHTFRFNEVPREQQCIKCGAIQRWGS